MKCHCRECLNVPHDNVHRIYIRTEQSNRSGSADSGRDLEISVQGYELMTSPFNEALGP